MLVWEEAEGLCLKKLSVANLKLAVVPFATSSAVVQNQGFHALHICYMQKCCLAPFQIQKCFIVHIFPEIHWRSHANQLGLAFLLCFTALLPQLMRNSSHSAAQQANSTHKAELIHCPVKSLNAVSAVDLSSANCCTIYDYTFDYIMQALNMFFFFIQVYCLIPESLASHFLCLVWGRSVSPLSAANHRSQSKMDFVVYN